jgi:hypothetical protein
VSEAVIEATKDVEDEGVVPNWLAKIGKLVGHLLELTAVIVDGEITLDNGMKLSVEERTNLHVADELLLQP